MSLTERLLRSNFKLQQESFFGRRTTDQNLTAEGCFKPTRVVSNIRQKFLQMNKHLLSPKSNKAIQLSSKNSKVENLSALKNSISNILPKVKLQDKDLEVRNMYIIQKDVHKKNLHKKFLKSKLQNLIKKSIVLDEETVEVMVKLQLYRKDFKIVAHQITVELMVRLELRKRLILLHSHDLICLIGTSMLIDMRRNILHPRSFCLKISARRK
jgi:hypothetical protein